MKGEGGGAEGGERGGGEGGGGKALSFSFRFPFNAPSPSEGFAYEKDWKRKNKKRFGGWRIEGGAAIWRIPQFPISSPF